MKLSTEEFLERLDIDQLRFCLNRCQAKINQLLEEPKRIVWEVIVDEYLVDGRYETEDYEKAWDRLAALKGRFMKQASVFTASEFRESALSFNRDIPCIRVGLVGESEYENLIFDERAFD